jgi:hypothetical protein
VITPARVLDAMLAADALGQEGRARGGNHRRGDRRPDLQVARS